jgi:hypothetical protein
MLRERLIDPLMTREVAEDGFNLALLEAVDEGLLILGENARHLIYHIVEKMYRIKREQIPEKPEALHEALEGSLGSRARVVEKLIAKEFYSRLGLSFKGCENFTLAECISYAKKHNKNTDRATLSQLLAQIRYLRSAVNVPEQEILQNAKEVRVPQGHGREDPIIRPKAKPMIKDVIIEMMKAKGLDPERVLVKEFLAEPHRIQAPPSERESFEIRALSKALLESLKKDLLDAQNPPNRRHLRGEPATTRT